MRESALKVQEEKAVGPRSMDRWLMVVCAVVVLLVYGRLFAGHFTFLDDRGTLTENPYFNPPSWHSIGYYWSHSAADLYVPVTYTLWGLLAKATYVPTPDESGVHLDAHLFHTANIFLHVIAVCLAFRLLQLLGLRSWGAFFGAMVFALHPLQVESVAWVSGMKDVLSGTLSLGAMCLYVRFARAEQTRWGWFAAATVCYVLAMLSKPGAVVLPGLVVVVEYFRLRPGRENVAGLTDAVLEKRRTPTLALPLSTGRGDKTQAGSVSWKMLLPAVIWLVLAIPIVIVGRSAQAAWHAHSVPVYFRPVLAGNALAFYLGKVFWPTRLGFDYGLRPTGMMHQLWPYWVCAAAVVVGVVIACVRKAWVSAGALWFAICLLPVLGLVSFDWEWYSLVADHYVYLAMFGVGMVVGWGVEEVAFANGKKTPAEPGANGVRKGAIPVVVGVLGIGVVVALAVGAFLQTRYWMNNRVLCERAIAVNPRSFAAYAMLGLEEAGTNVQAAIADCRKSLAIEPGYYADAEVLEMILARQRRYAEAIAVIDQVNRYSDTQNPGQRADPTRYLRRVAMIAEEQKDFHVAIECYGRILARRPEDGQAREAMERIQAEVGGGAGVGR